MCFFSACKKQSQPLSEEESITAIETAVNNLQSKTVFEVKTDMGLLGTGIFAQNEGGSYTSMWGTQSWTKTEDDVVYQYSIYTMEMDDEEITSYTKSVYDEDEDNYDFDMSEVELPEGATFVSGKVEGERKTIVYKAVEDGATIFATYVIENDLIVSLSAVTEQGATQIVMTIKYDAEVIIPAIPTVDGEGNPIVWSEW